jgi:prolyl 4-hydroxylase
MKKIEYNHEIFVIEDFLTKEECEELILKSEKIGYEEAKVQTGENTQSILKGVRNNDRILYKDEVLATKLYEKAKPFLIEIFDCHKIVGLNEMFRFYKYSPGQRFKMHRDGSYKRNETETSFFTFLLYLNDDFEGGETEFQDLFTVKPKTGDLLVFYHPYRHEGKLLVSGYKYALRSDVMYKIQE